MRTQNCDSMKNMKDVKLYSPPAESTKTIFMENASVSKKEITANQTTLHSTQLIRNVPNILRNSNIKTHKNDKTLTLYKSDTSFTSSTEDINISLELNTTFSSNESEKETNYKIASPKSYHQRKQVHNPIDLQYDVPDWNNKNNKIILQEFDQLNALQNYKKDVSKKKLKHNKRKKCLFNEKSKEITICKTNSSMEKSYKKLDFDTRPTISPDINIKNTVVQSAIFSNNVFTESTSGSDTAKYINELDNIEIQSDELCNTSYDVSCDEICSFEKYDINCNSVIPSKSTECSILQPESFQEDVTNFKILMTEEGVKEELINRDIESDFLFDSKILYTCTCVNCTSCEKDIIFCEDPVSTFANTDTDTEFFTSYVYDSFIHDYQIGDNILDDNWLKEFDKNNFYREEVEEKNITKEATYIDSNNVMKLIESNTNVPSTEKCDVQNSQTCYINKTQDTCVKSYSAELIETSNEPIQSLKSVENAKILDEVDYINLENILMKEGKVISQDEALIETTNSTDELIFKSKSQKENKKDLCVIQCTQCGRLFNKKHQFRKHFTRCDFYKEDFKCHICDKIYKHKSSFDQHLRKVHHLSYNPDQKFYTCNKCSKLYVRFRAFQRHLLLHDD